MRDVRERILDALASAGTLRWDALVSATATSPDAVSDAVEVLLAERLVVVKRARVPRPVSFEITDRGRRR